MIYKLVQFKFEKFWCYLCLFTQINFKLQWFRN